MFERDANGWTPDDYRTLIREAYGARYQPEDFLAFATNESGLVVSRGTGPKDPPKGPFAHNLSGDASGLWQAMPQILKNLGFPGTHADFREAGVSTQLKWFTKYVEDWRGRLHFGEFRTAGSLYLLNFAPAYLAHKDDPDFKIFDSNKTKEFGSWRVNRGLDHEQIGHPRIPDPTNPKIIRKGYINVRDLTITVDADRYAQVYKTAVSSLNKLAQAGLNAAGASLVEDGAFGPLSTLAFKAWAQGKGYTRLDGAARFALL